MTIHDHSAYQGLPTLVAEEIVILANYLQSNDVPTHPPPPKKKEHLELETFIF